MNPTLLECRNITKSFIKNGQEICILDDINLTVSTNEVVVISGKSGEGKSVLLWLLAGLDQPTSGDIFFEKKSYQKLSSSDFSQLRRTDMALIFQDFNLIPTWTALENVLSALVHVKMTNKDKKEKAAAMLDRLGLANRSGYLPSELSIGQQQRVAIARNLICGPKLILADEPTGALDPETGDEIIELLKGPVKEGTSSLIVTTHGNFPLHKADRVLYLQNRTLKD